MVPRAIRRGVRESIAHFNLDQCHRSAKTFPHVSRPRRRVWTSFYFDNFFSAYNSKDQCDLLTDGFHDGIAAGSAYRNVLGYWEKSSGELLQRLLYTDIKTYLVELLMKQDNMSMAASIESRVPFLDHVLVEWAARVPANIQIHGTAGKRILKKAMEPLLPHSIIYRPKFGFPTPWSGWLAGARVG